MNNLIKELFELREKERELLNKIHESKDEEANRVYNLLDTNVKFLVKIENGKIFIKDDYICEYKDFLDAQEQISDKNKTYKIVIYVKDPVDDIKAIEYQTKDSKRF